MRLLLDNNLPERLVQLLGAAGWDVLHVRALGLHAATDPVVMERARSDARILVSADTDFGALLAASRAAGPSVVLVRRLAGRRAAELAGVLLANLPVVAADLDAGAVVTVTDDALRVRRLPLT